MIKKIGKITILVILGIFLISFIYVTVMRVAGITPNIFGFSIMRVETANMDPAIRNGDVIVVQRKGPKDIDVNDVITYRATEGVEAGKTVTGQVVEKTENPDGSYTFTARGIKEGCVNDYPFSDSQVVGKVLCKIPVLGTLYDFFTRWYGWLVIVALMLVAFSDDIYNLIRRISDKKKDTPAPDEIKHPAQPKLNTEIGNEISRQADELFTDLDDPTD